MHAILQIALNTSVFAMALENTVNIIQYQHFGLQHG